LIAVRELTEAELGRVDRVLPLHRFGGYVCAPIKGTITIRGEPVQIDDTLMFCTKRVVDLATGRSS
jgi:hypothetical protein